MFDPEGAENAKNAAIKRISKNTCPKWFAAAFDAGVVVALAYPEFTTDHIWACMDDDIRYRVHDRRAMVSVTKALESAGYAAYVGEKRSSLKVCHKRLKGLYQSLIHSDVVA